MSVADQLVQDNLDVVRRLSPEERVSLALEWGDFDLALYCARQEVEISEAVKALRQSRQIGRRTRAPSEDHE